MCVQSKKGYQYVCTMADRISLDEFNLHLKLILNVHNGVNITLHKCAKVHLLGVQKCKRGLSGQVNPLLCTLCIVHSEKKCAKARIRIVEGGCEDGCTEADDNDDEQ